MTELEKLYENAEIKKEEQGYCNYDYGIGCPYDHEDCYTGCPYWKKQEPDYPPFTAEKQLKLIDFLSKYEITIINESNTPDYQIYTYDRVGSVSASNIGELMAKYINMFIWRNLTEEEQQQIKEILK